MDLLAVGEEQNLFREPDAELDGSNERSYVRFRRPPFPLEPFWSEEMAVALRGELSRVLELEY